MDGGAGGRLGRPRQRPGLSFHSFHSFQSFQSLLPRESRCQTPRLGHRDSQGRIPPRLARPGTPAYDPAMGEAILFMGLLGALTVGGLLLVFLVLRNRLDGLAAELGALRRDVDAAGGAVKELAARAEGLASASAPAASELAEPALTVDFGGQLDPLFDEVTRMRREVQGLGRRVGELAGELETERGRRLGETIRERFERQGFQSIRVLSDPSELEGAEARVPIEGVKGGITYKGYVLVEDGRVVDEKMTSSYEVFP